MGIIGKIKEAYRVAKNQFDMERFFTNKDMLDGTLYYLIYESDMKTYDTEYAFDETRLSKLDVSITLESTSMYRKTKLSTDPETVRFNKNKTILTTTDAWEHTVYVTKDPRQARKIIKHVIAKAMKESRNKEMTRHWAYSIYKEMNNIIKKKIKGIDNES